ncbi:MAG TPA: glycosyltransferase family 4 protein [Gaiellaceae bacterium]
MEITTESSGGASIGTTLAAESVTIGPIARLRVLVVLTQPPLPEGGAPGKVAVGLLRGLQGHGLDVRALAARQHFAVPGAIPGDLTVEQVEIAPPGRWEGRLGRVARPRGELAGPFAARVAEAARDADVVYLDQVETVWCAEGLSTPHTLHLHYLARLDRGLGAPHRRRFREVLDQERAERRALRTVGQLVASSPVVAAELRRRAPAAEITLAPLSLDPGLYPPAPLDGPPRAGLIGTAAWPPTAAALRVLLEDVWPRVQAPDANLVIAGRGTERFGGSGEIDSARDFFQGLSLLLFPLPRGSGMKVKTLEAMASGVPVVTTPAGAEGIERSDGVIVETEPERLAAAARELLTDEAAKRERGAAARADFERHYAPGPATAPLVGLFDRLLT